MNTYKPSKPFRPAWWCCTRHLQTMFSRFFHTDRILPLARRRLETPDGDFLDLDCLPGERGKPHVLIVHGLAGSSHAPYVHSFLSDLEKQGWPGTALNYRGCSGELNRTRVTYHSGKTEDLDLIVHDLIEKQGVKTLYLVGYSIGGNIVLKWLGEKGADLPKQVKKAVTISAPTDLVLSEKYLSCGLNLQVYTRYLLWTLKAQARLKEKQFPGLFNRKQLWRCRTFRDFDSLVTAPLNGFKNALDYWRQSSSAQYMKDIRCPTLLIHAEDDPFFPGKELPYNILEASEYLNLLMTKRGGHMGFIQGKLPWKQELWLEDEMMHFLESE